MYRYRLITLFVIGLIGMAMLGGHARASTLYTVSGRVTDQTGTAVVATTVEALDTGGATVASSTSTSVGNYSLTLAAATYTFRVTPPSGSAFQVSTVPNRSITANTTLDFTLVPAGAVTLSGRVVDRDGKGVPNQRLRLTLQNTNNYVDSYSDATGAYQFTVAPGPYTLYMDGGNTDPALAIPRRHYRYSLNSFTLSQNITMDITIPGQRVQVHVQDPAGNPVSNVALTTTEATNYSLTLGTIPAYGGSLYPTTSTLERTDANGDAILWLFPSGTNTSYIFTATPPTGGAYSATNVSGIAVTADRSLTITLQQPVTLKGRALDRDGKGVPNQRLRLTLQNTNNYVDSYSDATGAYQFTVAPGPYTLYMDGGNTDPALAIPRRHYRYSLNSFTLSQNITMDITIPGQRVQVHVQDPAGNPVSNVALTTTEATNYSLTLGTIPAYGGSLYPTTSTLERTDANGDAILWLFPSGTNTSYIFTATPPTGGAYSATNVSGIAVTADRSLTITLQQPVTLKGRALDRDGKGVPNQRLRLTLQNTNNYVDSYSDATGAYQFTVAPGPYTLYMDGGNTDPALAIPRRHYRYSLNSFTLSQNITMDITIPGQRVQVHVQDPAGNPVSNVALTTTEATNYSLTLGTIPAYGGSLYPTTSTLERTDANGDAILWLFPSGTNTSYIFTATPPVASIFTAVNISGIQISQDTTKVIVLQFIHAPPITTATITPTGIASVYPAPVTVSLSATAASGYTIANTYYTIDGGAQQTYTGPLTISGNGDHTLRFWSIDNSGVYEAANTRSLRIDGLRIVTASPLPSGTVGENYSTTLVAAGGVAPYTWSVASGSLPPGLSLDEASGAINGTPTAAGTFSFVIRATDSNGTHAEGSFAFAPPPPEGTAGTTYTVPIIITPPSSENDPAPACSTYAVVTGTLPPGVTLNTQTGVLSGTLEDGGQYTFTIGCQTSTGQSVTKEFTITIYNPVPTLTSLSPDSVIAEGSTFTLTLTGTRFVRSSVVRWNGSDRPTAYISATQLTAQISASDIATAGSASLTVYNPAPGDATSNSLALTIREPNQQPTVTAGGPYSVTEGASVTLKATGSDPDGDTLSYAWDLDNNGSYETAGQTVSFSAATIDGPAERQVAVRVADPKGASATALATITINNVAPTMTIVATPATINEGSSTIISLENAFDAAAADQSTLRYSIDCTNDGVWESEGTTTSTSCAYDDSGTYTVLGRIADDDGGVTEYTLPVTVQNVAPTATISAALESIDEGQHSRITLSQAHDPASADVTAGFRYAFDCTDDGSWEVQASTDPSYDCAYPDNGVYTVRAQITDKDTGSSSSTITITVANLPPIVSEITAPIEPMVVNSTMTASASFSDAGILDTHTATWDWGNGMTSTATVTETGGAGTVSDSTSYTTPGVYTIKLTVTDDDEGSGQSFFRYIVVYDPNGGFVTGVGWITSPVGACQLTPSCNTLSGKASFGFVSKYQKGAAVPSGKTDFQFKAGNLDFNSTAYDWLVVAGAKAQFKGVGTINNQGSYGFMLTATDGQITSGSGIDTFRIKIWDIASGVIVYDNQMGAGDDAVPTTMIGGGSIVIHKEK